MSILTRTGHATFFARLQHAVRRLLGLVRAERTSGRYRPEKHYMRGPGPKSRGGDRRDS